MGAKCCAVSQIPRDMPNSDIWERNQYEVSAAFAAANSSAADAEEEEDDE